MSNGRYPRHPKATLTALGALGTHLRNPWVSAWWSATLPGFGHMLISNHLSGIILITWEFIINYEAHINTAIVLSLTGRFQEAKDVVDYRWLLLYVTVYVYAMWDSYTETIEQNKYYILAEREDFPISPSKITVLEFGFGKKRKPLLAILWSLLTPGLGHLYVRKVEDALTLLVSWIVIGYMSHFCEAIVFTLVGDFDSAKAIVNYQWLLFAPSLYGYAAYASYAAVVEVNKYFDAEQARYLKQTYMDPEFTMPL
jgi:TM2 domain-containing membrane protein YozV